MGKIEALCCNCNVFLLSLKLVCKKKSSVVPELVLKPQDFAAPNLSFVEALEAVADGEHLVALGDAHPDGRAHGRVHASRGGAHVQDGHVEVALRTVMEGVNITGNADASHKI